MSLELQPKLLRGLLQGVDLNRWEACAPRASTFTRGYRNQSRSSRQMVGEREFREDLYYRLNIFPIACAAARRKADISKISAPFRAYYAELHGQNDRRDPLNTMQSLVRHTCQEKHSRAAKLRRPRRHPALPTGEFPFHCRRKKTEPMSAELPSSPLESQSTRGDPCRMPASQLETRRSSRRSNQDSD